MMLQGDVFRHQKGRLTQRITLNHQHYFIKQHIGVGVKEIIKNLFQLRLPIVSAKNEWRAIQKCHDIGIPAPRIAGYGKRGLNPARLQSFILMHELSPILSLEDLTKKWHGNQPPFRFKMHLILEIARIVRTMHHAGMNHRDCYLCHFLLDLNDTNIIYLLDLHRAQIRKKTPSRWKIKDLAGLYFSSKHIKLTSSDYFRFKKAYRQKSLHDILFQDENFWKKVKIRGEKLYRHENKSIMA